jgi:hypothetical protein
MVSEVLRCLLQKGTARIVHQKDQKLQEVVSLPIVIVA